MPEGSSRRVILDRVRQGSHTLPADCTTIEFVTSSNDVMLLQGTSILLIMDKSRALSMFMIH